ncbi:MAG TPA: tRNA (5-methylaminomethyl-2-thiouridine)(34)-methyltransferase MnmD [Flavobacteriales bacterium]
MFTPPSDLRLHRTQDGSFTLHSAALDEPYHSLHGALQESRHVFLQQGFHALEQPSVDLLEIGLGTGLNVLLTWIEADAGRVEVRYTALEPYPLPQGTLAELAHARSVGAPERADGLLRMMTAPVGEWTGGSDHFTLRRLDRSATELEGNGSYDLIYFDAFGPATQPELWTLPVFERMYRALRPGGILVTYCAKGDVRRAMQAAGLHVERLPGPPGKREMMRARRPIAT